jgi:hypothetical protein
LAEDNKKDDKTIDLGVGFKVVYTGLFPFRIKDEGLFAVPSGLTDEESRQYFIDYMETVVGGSDITLLVFERLSKEELEESMLLDRLGKEEATKDDDPTDDDKGKSNDTERTVH